MENKNRGKGFHVTIVDNNTGETIRDFDTRAIMLVALKDMEEGEKIARERNVFATAGMMQSNLADGINVLESFSMINGLQKMLAEEIEEHPEIELLTKIFDSETVQIDEEED
jgi:hypothetical protein